MHASWDDTQTPSLPCCAPFAAIKQLKRDQLDFSHNFSLLSSEALTIAKHFSGCEESEITSADQNKCKWSVAGKRVRV